MAERVIAIIDGNSLVHRAFHALPITLTGSDGRPTNAVYGFLTMLFRLVDELGPFGVVVAFDCGKPQFRIDVFEQYKVHRPPTAPELKDQFPMVKRVLEAMDVPAVECEGWEGDDLLGTLSEKAVEAGHAVLLVTGDKDAMQLVDENVSVVTSRKGVSDLVIYRPEEVRERFGVGPERITDYLGLKGDSSDNIPGVPGIGEKTATKLLSEYGTLDALLERADEVKGKVGENLRAHAQDAIDSRTVATIRRDVPVEIDFRESRWGGWDPADVLDVFRDLRVASLAGRVLSDGEIDVAEAAAPSRETHPLVTGPEAIKRVEAAMDGDAWLGVVLDGEGGDSLLPTSDLAVALGSQNALVSGDAVAPTVERLLSEACVASPDVKALLHAGADPREGGSTLVDAADPARLFDCSLAAYLLDSAASSYDVRALHAEETGAALDAGEDAHGRMAAEAQASADLAPLLGDRLRRTGSLDCFERCEMALVPVLARMEAAGVAVDCEALDGLAVEMGGSITALVGEIHEMAGGEFNIDSPKQLSAVLFEDLGLPPGKRTKTGFSTDSSVLTPLAEEYPIAGRVIEYRELAKLKSTYVDALPRLVADDGRVHTTFNQTVAATGRLSSSNPNLQNIPVRTALGRRIRAAFVPGTGFDLLLAADYSQIELRILAHVSGDEGLVEAFTSGVDFHTATAARVFGVQPDQVDTGLRSRAKATNFGIVYGISAHGLSLQLGVGRAEAQEMIDRYYAAYPRVREFLDEAVVFAKDNGYSVTMFGRRRPIPELSSRNFAVRSFGERTAMNHPMQGAAADIMKLAMVEVDGRLREEGLASRLVLQVHDELVFEVAATEPERLGALASEAMSGVAELAVPLVVDVSTGGDWAAAK